MTLRYRGYIVSPVGISPTLVQIATEGQGGKIPDILKGYFTGNTTARQLIDHYLDTQKVMRVDGKTNPKSGD